MKKIIQTTAGLQEVDSDLNPESFSPEELQESQRQKKISVLRDDLKAVPNINKLRADSISILNQINSNGFTAEDTIPAIKKIAETQKAILDTLLNL